MSYPQRYGSTRRVQVRPMLSADDVVYSLNSTVSPPTHEYIMAVMHSYIDIKLSRGKTKNEIGWKLDSLERELPQFATQWALVRQQYALPPSHTLRAQNSIRRTSSHQPQAPPPRQYPPERSNGLTVVRVNTTPARPVQTVRPVPLGDDEELPPPPYTAADPEPDQTRMLEERLAQEAVATGHVEPEPERFSPPAGPPPQAQRQATPQTSPPETPGSDADDEVRRVWEESQLDEAKRASRAAEQERIELEEAMRLSLAEAEAVGVASSVAGPSTMPPRQETPPSRPMPQIPNVNTTPRPLPRPHISSPTLAPPQSTFHRRTASDVGPGFASMSIAEFDPLGDDSSMPSVAPLQPTKTGAVLRSNNPFLSPADSPRTEAMRKPLPPSPGEVRYDPPPGPPPHALPPPLPPRSSTLVAGEDPLDALRSCDTVFLIDDSASMAGERWEEAKASLKGVADIAAQYDDDGIDIYFLNSKRVGTELRNSADVEELFEGLVPKGSTPTGARLDAILQKYLSRLEKAKSYDETVKPLNLIIVTDGTFALPILARARQLQGNAQYSRAMVLDSAPADDPEVVLVAAAQRLDRGEFPMSQLGIQFLQIGNEPEATAALRELDDGLSHAHDTRDIVDTVLFSGEAMTASYVIKTLLGGINKRLDRA